MLKLTTIILLIVLIHELVVLAFLEDDQTNADLEKTQHPKKVATKSKKLNCDTTIKATINPLCYPQPERGDVVDDYHGIKVPDPYRALEDPDSNKTAEFVRQLNALSQPFFEASPVRKQMQEKYEKLINYEKFGITTKEGPYYYYTHNTGLQSGFYTEKMYESRTHIDQNVLYQQKSLDENGTVFLDPNTLSKDGTSAVTVRKFTEDGTILAYGISEKGSDWTTVKFKSVDGKNITDEIPNIRFSDLAWLHDNSGLFYSKYPNVTSAKEKLQFHSLYFHQMGTDAKEDIRILERKDDPGSMRMWAHVSEDGRFLFAYQSFDFATNELHIFDLAKPIIAGQIEAKPLFTKMDARYFMVDSDADSALILTNHEAPMFKLVRIKLAGKANQNDEWEEVIGEEPDRKLEWARPVDGDKLIVCYIEDVKHALYVHDLQSGARLYQIPLDIGTIGEVWTRKSSSEFFMFFSSFLVPGIVYHGNFGQVPEKGDEMSNVQLRELRRAKVAGLESDQFVVKQVFYPSKDGTKIPMYIYHDKDLQLDGTNPTLLYGYGGFNVALMPSFSVPRLMWVKHFGGVMAIANIRGGSEYGEKWYKDGIMENKQNSFDDFIAAAEHLIYAKYTNSKKLAIQGGSNGGLLTAACAGQRPDLYGAVLTEVGITDMLRFNKFTAGSIWVKEYGNPQDPAQFSVLFKYSPLHNLAIKRCQQWPSHLLTTADHDDRVVPMHTLKYTAQLYHLLATEAREWHRNPVLVRVEENAGHGAGKPTTKVTNETVDKFCFLQRVLSLIWKDE